MLSLRFSDRTAYSVQRTCPTEPALLTIAYNGLTGLNFGRLHLPNENMHCFSVSAIFITRHCSRRVVNFDFNKQAIVMKFGGDLKWFSQPQPRRAAALEVQRW